MNRFKQLLIFVLLTTHYGYCQKVVAEKPSPQVQDFSSIYQQLSSDLMEGREVGTPGGNRAAEYVLSMMKQAGLKPFLLTAGTEITNGYTQDFQLLKYKVNNASLSIFSNEEGGKPFYPFFLSKDFDLKTGPNSLSTEVPVVFVGYGICDTTCGFNDYANVEVKGKLVVAINGFPGYSDSLSVGYNKFRDEFSTHRKARLKKQQEAKKRGASAMIFLSTKPENDENTTIEEVDDTTSFQYVDAEYLLPSDTTLYTLPLFEFKSVSSAVFATTMGVDIPEYELMAQKLCSSKITNKSKFANISVTVEKEAINAKNLIGIIKGSDSTKYIIIGAHYDHLGVRNGLIFNGADDNASGVTGLLALARMWAQSGVQPPVSIIFASWDAEEKGLLGSQYFAQSLSVNHNDIKFYINMDMISGSAVEDSAQNQLSIGTRKEDVWIREEVSSINASMEKPFELDLWEVNGYTGSDYASFTEKDVPVMTFNSGLHDYYHTPRDVYSQADLNKMQRILDLVNTILNKFLQE